MNGYYSAISAPDRKGACFMAVCRGKVSEGLDFCDGNGRAVIITGLPFPPSRDPRVLEKQKYLEDNRRDPKFQGLTGQQWYRLEATRAVNQVYFLSLCKHSPCYVERVSCNRLLGESFVIGWITALFCCVISDFLVLILSNSFRLGYAQESKHSLSSVRC